MGRFNAFQSRRPPDARAALPHTAERDLVDLFGDDYRRYRDRVSMLVPWRKSA
jgi:hypothetical protein